MRSGGLWWRVAWRNLWRNRRRTLITAAALAFGYLASVTMIGIWYGVVEEMIDAGTELVSGQVQVHSEDFLPERGLHATLGGREGIDLDAFLTRAERVDGVVAAAPRVFGGGLISSGEQTVAGIVMGVDPDREARVTRILDAIVEGRPPVVGAREVILGDDMAERLEVGIGDEVVMVTPAADGSLGNDLFTVSGILHTGLPPVDQAHVLMPYTDLQELLVLDSGRVHEVTIRVEGAWDAPLVAASLVDGVDGEEAGAVSVRPWTEFRAELAEYARLAFAANGIVVGVIFGMAIFGVANTMLMSTFERRREFAVARAIGTAPSRIARMVVYEGLSLGLISLLAGALVTAPILYWLHEFPIDISRFTSDITMAGSVMRPLIRVEYTTAGPVASAIGLLVTSLLAALYPAYRAVKVPPADALSD